MASFRIVAHQFPATLLTDDEQVLAVLAENRRQKIHGSRSDLHGSTISELPKGAFFLKYPNIGLVMARRLEREVLPIRGPVSTALRGRVVPPRQQRARISSVGENLPQRRCVRPGIAYRKPQHSTIRRPARPKRDAWNRD